MKHKFEFILTRTLERAIALFLFAIFVIVLVLVAARYLKGASVTGANEIITVLFIYATSIGAALAIGRDEHLSIVFVLEKFPRRVRSVAEVLRILLVGLINGVVLYYSLSWIQTTGGYLMPSTNLPRWVVQLSIPLGCTLALIYCALRLIHRNPPETEEPASEVSPDSATSS